MDDVALKEAIQLPTLHGVQSPYPRFTIASALQILVEKAHQSDGFLHVPYRVAPGSHRISPSPVVLIARAITNRWSDNRLI